MNLELFIFLKEVELVSTWGDVVIPLKLLSPDAILWPQKAPIYMGIL